MNVQKTNLSHKNFRKRVCFLGSTFSVRMCNKKLGVFFVTSSVHCLHGMCKDCVRSKAKTAVCVVNIVFCHTTAKFILHL